MPMYATPQEAPPTLPPGTYQVQLMELQSDTLENTRNPDVWRFLLETRDVLDPTGNPYKIDGVASQKLTPKAKAWEWFTALGLNLQPGIVLDLENAVGNECLAVVTNKPGRDGTGSFARVDSLIPMPGRRAQQAPADDIGSWWAEVRGAGPTVKEATDKAVELYGKEPKDCTVLERVAVLQALTT